MDEKKLKEFTKKRTKLIASLMSSMDGQVKDNQKKLLEKVLEKFVDKLEKDENGNVKNNDRNRNLLIQFDDIFKEYQKKKHGTRSDFCFKASVQLSISIKNIFQH